MQRAYARALVYITYALYIFFAELARAIFKFKLNNLINLFQTTKKRKTWQRKIWTFLRKSWGMHQVLFTFYFLHLIFGSWNFCPYLCCIFRRRYVIRCCRLRLNTLLMKRSNNCGRKKTRDTLGREKTPPLLDVLWHLTHWVSRLFVLITSTVHVHRITYLNFMLIFDLIVLNESQ